MKKLTALVFALTLFAAGLSATVTVTLAGTVIADYDRTPDFEHFLSAPFGSHSFKGFQWDVAIDHVGLGGNYTVDFGKDASAFWWLDWYSVPFYVGYHLFGTGGFIDPFVEAGVGCVGQVVPRAAGNTVTTLKISLFPSLVAGLALDLKPFLVSAKLAWAPGVSEIPFTSIPGYSLGGVQIALVAGFRIGGRD
jgi:hypothetical protein